MSLAILRDDALTTETDASALRLSLPWIRSLPLACLRDVAVSIDGSPVEGIRVRLADRDLDPRALADVEAWWHVQDRVALTGIPHLSPGEHHVDVSFSLLIPYLPGGHDAPLTLPFREDRRCVLDAVVPRADVARDVI
ncbi:hypothetical protein [Microbacterium sp. NPDC058345]|uniref:hypothetical protein n=1 Tax=Microbacterium sp. NPDC058345 TaxID=3346455 RepID=UPI0036589EAC